MHYGLAPSKGAFAPNPRCLSCGRTLESRRRRYCSRECRQELDRRLNLAIGLLATLNVRFATFSFSEDALFLHVLQHRSRVVLSYTCKRSPHRRPAQDLWDLVEGLGRVWHARNRETGKRYLADQEVLGRALRNRVPPDAVMPREERKPAFAQKSLAYLKLTSADVLSADAARTIKTAYRREVKVHHPDHGGDAARFRAIHKAHTDLANWVRHPTYKVYRGIPEKWSFDSQRRTKWLPPARGRIFSKR